MKINRNEIFRYLEEKFGNEYYIGLHGISDNPDIKNEYSDMPKVKKVKNILNKGLKNERHLSIKSTCCIFGRLTDTYNNEKKTILQMNRYNCYRTNNEHIIVIVAVPIVYKHSDGRKIFGGWMNPNQRYSDDDSPFECITDKLFEKEIPKEMIYGYYCFGNDDKEAELVLNEKFYEQLTQNEKDSFIQNVFDKNGISIDLNQEDYEKDIREQVENQDEAEFIELRSNNRFGIRKNTYNVLLQEKTIEQARKLKNEKQQEKVETKEGYTFDEIEKLPIEKIDLEKIRINYDIITKSKYQIKDILINSCFKDNVNLANEVGYYKVNNISEEDHVNIDEFEKWVNKYGNTPKNLYELQYERYYKEIEFEFKKKIKEMQEKKMNNINVNLEEKVKEYMQIGNAIGLFEKSNLKDVYNKIKDVEIIEDNSITGDAVAIMEKGKNIIKINAERCKGKGEYFLDEVIFHELTHFTNQIHNDLYGNGTHKIRTFKNQYSDFSKTNKLVKFPEWGGILLDEAIAQKVAQIMCEKKYGRKIYQTRLFRSKLIDDSFLLTTSFADYPEYEALANNFAKTVVGNEGLFGLAKLSMKKDGIDTILEKYSKQKDGARKLYETLGYMGNIAIADYASKGHFIVPNSEENRTKQNVLESMQKARWIMQDTIEQTGPSFND